MPEPKTVYFYGLCEPETGEVRYIGKSIRPFERAVNHLNDRSRCHRTNWIQSVLARGLEPTIKILGWVSGDEAWQPWEKWHIAMGKRKGWHLTNSTIGGDGVPELPPEIKERIRQASIGRKITVEQQAKRVAKIRGKRQSEESKERRRQAMLGRKITWIGKIAEKLRKLSDSDVAEIYVRLRKGEGVQKLAAEFGVHRTTLSKIKMGTYQRLRQ